ncbi:MAG: hypothetical protein ACI4UE_00420 [Candidatus Scatovivens sp.]
MKRKISLLISLLLVLLLTFSISLTAFAVTSNPLDEILYYEVIIDPRSDGTLDMKYKINWKVLDSEREGPLQWVKIGVPNSHVDEIVGISNNIDEIRYYEEGGSNYIRIDLDRDYLKDETLTLEYSIHQSYMYIVEEDKHLIRYSFTAGWFPDIEVKELKILWNSRNVLEVSSNGDTLNGYYIWSSPLKMNEKFNISVKYNSDVFEYNLDEQYKEEKGSSLLTVILIGIIIALLILFIIVGIAEDNNYDGGYGGSGSNSGSRSSVFIHSSCASRSSCACVSTCACACACAGGGRAGCTKKDFYHTNLSSNDFNEVIESLK